MSKLQNARRTLSALSITTVALVLALGPSLSSAQSAPASDGAAAARSAEKSAVKRPAVAAPTSSALTYDALGATPHVRPPVLKSKAGEQPKAPEKAPEKPNAKVRVNSQTQ